MPSFRCGRHSLVPIICPLGNEELNELSMASFCCTSHSRVPIGSAPLEMKRSKTFREAFRHEISKAFGE